MLGLLTMIFYSLSSSEAKIIDNLTQHVGGNCGSTTTYNIFFVDIAPWPPAPGEVAELTMQGQFLQTTYVQEIVFGTCYNGMIWNYQPVDVDQTFAAGEVIDFINLVVFPNENGSYLSNIQLTAGDHICCWQFQYNIS